jgi:hypothetical protein
MNRIHFLIFIVTFVHYAKAKGYFTIVGSEPLRFNKPYTVSVNYENYSEEYTLEIELSGGKRYNEKREVKLEGFGTKTIEFKVQHTFFEN